MDSKLIRTIAEKSVPLGKDGVSLLGISKAAEEIGFKTIGGRLSFDTLTSEVPLPCIIHWNQNHFVVVYKIKKRRGNRYEVYVADPGKGLITYTKEEFCEHWVSTKTNGEEKGIALLLEPTEQFYAQNDTKAVPTQSRVKFLWSYLKKYKRFFTQLILGLLLGSLLQLVFPFLTQAIVDTGIGGKDVGFVWLVLLAEMMLLFSRTAIDFIPIKDTPAHLHPYQHLAHIRLLHQADETTDEVLRYQADGRPFATH